MGNVTSAKEVMVLASVCVFVNQQDYAKITGEILTKLGGKTRNWLKKKPFNLGTDPNKASDAGL